ncbi:MAG: M15 family metallopeptidase [Ferruginibacter sp.]
MQIKLINTERYFIITLCLFFNSLIVYCLNDTIISKNKRLTGQQHRAYESLVKTDPLARMVPIFKKPGLIKLDLRYQTASNFTGKVLYAPTACTFLRKPVYDALMLAAASFRESGFGIVIWDAYRPYNATVTMWELIQDERYVAHPAKGSGHNRGIAVDLTLYRLSDGLLLDMGTDFDEFTEKAHVSFTNLPQAVLDNREILQSTMEKAGFKVLETEWWHFYWPGGNDFTILDLSFDTLLQSYNKSRK